MGLGWSAVLKVVITLVPWVVPALTDVAEGFPPAVAVDTGDRVVHAASDQPSQKRRMALQKDFTIFTVRPLRSFENPGVRI